MSSPGLLGDTSARDYSHKLRLFNSCAETELREAISSLKLVPGMRVLDAGCGTGEALGWLRAQVATDDVVVGMDLASAHTEAAYAGSGSAALIVQANLLKPPLRRASFDLIWSVNTVNHLHDPVAGVEVLASLLRPRGRVALGQSSLLPDMYFAWNARLERLVTEAVRQYYRSRYGLDERDLAAVRSIAGVLGSAGLHDIRVKTFTIERLFPLSDKDNAYLRETIFRDTWGERLRPYLATDDYLEMSRLCDPLAPQFALRRPDFHFLQTFTLAVGSV
jgi:SAM-dependent methyltransferase